MEQQTPFDPLTCRWHQKLQSPDCCGTEHEHSKLRRLYSSISKKI